MQKDSIVGLLHRVNGRKSMLIKVKCSLPKPLAGEYTFSSYHELSGWIHSKFRRPKSLAGQVIVRVSEGGQTGLFTGLYAIEVKSDSTLGYLDHRRLARESGVLVRKRGQFEDKWDFSSKSNVLRFAKLIDEKALKTS